MENSLAIEAGHHAGLSLKAATLGFVASTTAMTLLMILVGNLG